MHEIRVFLLVVDHFARDDHWDEQMLVRKIDWLSWILFDISADYIIIYIYKHSIVFIYI